MNIHSLVPDTKPDRTERFASRLDAKLKELPSDQARMSFLKGRLLQWKELKARFERDMALTDTDPGDVSIYDYALTIAEISVRLSRIECGRAGGRS